MEAVPLATACAIQAGRATRHMTHCRTSWSRIGPTIWTTLWFRRTSTNSHHHGRQETMEMPSTERTALPHLLRNTTCATDPSARNRFDGLAISSKFLQKIYLSFGQKKSPSPSPVKKAKNNPFFQMPMLYFSNSKHKKIHERPSERPHKCEICGQGFLSRKDRDRHFRSIHDQDGAGKFLCPVQGCKFASKGFTRKDKWTQHLRTTHANKDKGEAASAEGSAGGLRFVFSSIEA